MINFEFKGLDSLTKKIEKIKKELPNAVQKGINNALTNMQQDALNKIRGRNDVSMIPFTIEVDGTTIKGRLYTDRNTFSYASFLEYGTGTFAEREHIGTTKAFIESNYTFWYLPVDKADREFGSDRIVTFGNQQFYVMYPQQPRPFMRPTAFEYRDVNLEKIQEPIFNMLKGVLT